jgi:hypothetical protein
MSLRSSLMKQRRKAARAAERKGMAALPELRAVSFVFVPWYRRLWNAWRNRNAPRT